MIKSELVQRIAEHNPHLYQRDVENIVNAILDEIVAALARGDRVELRGFGAFSVKHRPARAGRNPRTGAHVPIEIREDVLDEDLAAKLLAEKAHVATHDRAEVEEYGRLANREGGKKLAEGFGAEDWIVRGGRRPHRARVGVLSARSEAI